MIQFHRNKLSGNYVACMGFLVCLKIHCRHNVFFAAKSWQVIWWRQPIVVAAASTQGVLDSDSFSSKPLQLYQVRRIDWRVWSETLEEVSSVTTCETKAKLSCRKTHSPCVWLKLLQQCRIHPWTYFALLVTYRSCQSPYFIRENVWKVWMCCDGRAHIGVWRRWIQTWSGCFVLFTTRHLPVRPKQLDVVLYDAVYSGYLWKSLSWQLLIWQKTSWWSTRLVYPGTFGTKLRRASKEQPSMVVVVWWSWLLCCFRNGRLAMNHKFSSLPENPKGQCPSISSETWQKANKMKGVNLKHCVYVMDLLLPVDSPSLALLPPLFWCVCSVDGGLDYFWVSTLLTCGWSLTCRGWKITALLKAEMDSHSLLEPRLIL